MVSRHTIELEVETGRLIILDVKGFPLQRKWYVVHRKGKRLSPSAQAFRDFLLESGIENLLHDEGIESVMRQDESALDAIE